MATVNSVVIGNFTDFVDIIDGIATLQYSTEIEPVAIFALRAVEPPVKHHTGVALRHYDGMLVSEIELHPVDISDLRYKFWLLMHIALFFIVPVIRAGRQPTGFAYAVLLSKPLALSGN